MWSGSETVITQDARNWVRSPCLQCREEGAVCRVTMMQF